MCQAFNWLLRSVTLPSSIHNLLWHFVASLSVTSAEGDEEGKEEARKKEKKEQDQVEAIVHGKGEGRGTTVVCSHHNLNVSIIKGNRMFFATWTGEALFTEDYRKKMVF